MLQINRVHPVSNPTPSCCDHSHPKRPGKSPPEATRPIPRREAQRRAGSRLALNLHPPAAARSNIASCDAEMVGSCLCLPFACVRRPRKGGIRASQPARPWFPPWPWLAPPTRRRTVPNGAFLCAMLAPQRGMRYCSLFKKQRAPPPFTHSMILCFDSSRAGNANIKRRRRCTASTARACNLGGSHHAFCPTVALCADGPCYQKAAALPIHTEWRHMSVRASDLRSGPCTGLPAFGRSLRVLTACAPNR